MKQFKFAVCVGAFALLSACVQMPTENAGIVDMRPQISFKSSLDVAGANVFVDGLPVGSVQVYLETTEKGGTALRVLPGVHQVRVVRGEQILLDERVYLADGVSKTLLVQ